MQRRPTGHRRGQRRIPKDGRVVVASQLLDVGRPLAGTTVTVAVEDNYYRILDGTNKSAYTDRTSTETFRNFEFTDPETAVRVT